MQRYCVTLGRGMEPFVQKQLEQIPNLKIGEILDGKMLFEADISGELFTLRSAERLFLVVACELIDGSWNKKQLFDKLFSMIGGTSLNALCEEAFHCLQQNEQLAERTFRVSLKATGKWRRKIDTEKLSASVARNIKRMTCFNSALRCAAVEICIHLSQKYIFIGIPMSRKPLSQRPYLLSNALRSTVVDAMLSLANIQDGDIVMDLTCGSSSVMLQAAHDFQDKVLLLGADISLDALQMSRKNLDHLRMTDNVEPLFELFAIDLFNDLPFGQLHGTTESVLRILQRVCDILSKCIRNDGSSGNDSSTAVLLISAVHLASIRSMLKRPIRLKEHYPISLGTTRAEIVLLINDINAAEEK